MDIDRPIAIALFALSLYGCGPDARTQVERVRRGDADALHGTVSVHAGRARFECVRSASGACHVSVRRSGCTRDRGTVRGCASSHRFTLAERRSREIDGLQQFTWCVSGDPQVPGRCREMRWVFTPR